MNLNHFFLLTSLATLEEDSISGKVFLKNFRNLLTNLPKELKSALTLRTDLSKVTFYAALRTLRKKGYLRIETKSGLPPENFYSITPLGREIVSSTRKMFLPDLNMAKIFPVEVGKSLTSQLGKQFKAWLTDWYQAGLKGDERKITRQIYRDYGRKTVKFVEKALGIEFRDKEQISLPYPSRNFFDSTEESYFYE